MDNGDDVAVVLQQNRDKVDALIEQVSVSVLSRCLVLALNVKYTRRS